MWTESEARRVLAEAGRSGLSLNAFGREHGIQPQRLYWWRDRLSAGGKRGDDIGFREVVVRANAPKKSDGAPVQSFEVRLNAVTVVVPGNFDEDALVRLLAALERASC